MTDELASSKVFPGRFWATTDEQRAGFGRLVVTEGASPRLELDQAITPLLREIAADSEGVRTLVFADDGPELDLFTVQGVLDDRTLVTLVDAFTTRRQSGPRHDRQALQARLALLGGHVSGSEQRYTEIRLKLRHLDAWTALPAFDLEHDPRQGTATLTFRGSSLNAVAIEGGGWLDVEQEPAVEFSELRGGRIGREVWLRVFDLPPMTLNELDQRFVTPLSSLLTLATDASCPPVQVEVSAGPEEQWLKVHYSGLQSGAEDVRDTRQQLLPLGGLGLERVATWLNAVEKLGPLPPVVAAAAVRRESTLETGLLELTTVAEGLHRVLFENSRRMSRQQAEVAREAVRVATRGLEERVRQPVEGALARLEEASFPQRLLELADYVAPAMPGVTGRTNRWKQLVTDTRNEFAHGAHGFLESERIPELVAVVESLRWLLTGLLLLQTGLPPDEFAARVEYHEPYDLFRRQVRSSVPRVFDVATD